MLFPAPSREGGFPSNVLTSIQGTVEHLQLGLGVSWSQVSSVAGRKGLEEETACGFASDQPVCQNLR